MSKEEFLKKIEEFGSILENDSTPEGLLGYCIVEDVDSYEEIGESLVRLLERADERDSHVIEQVIIAITGWGFDCLAAKMDDNAEYYSAL